MDLTTLLLAALTVGTACALPTTQLVTRRSFTHRNGTHPHPHNNTAIEDHPYLCAIVDADTNNVTCTCTIIHSEWVITSADCLQGRTKDKLYIVAGSTHHKNGTNVSISDIVVHPKYGEVILDYNVALVRGNKTFNYSTKVSPAVVPKHHRKNITEAEVSGWSITGNKNSSGFNWTIHDGNLTLLDTKSCKQFLYDQGLKYTNTIGCAYKKKNTTVCEGDWASPLVTNGTVNGTTVNLAHGLVVAVRDKDFCSPQPSYVLYVALSTVYDFIKNTTGIELYEG